MAKLKGQTRSGSIQLHKMTLTGQQLSTISEDKRILVTQLAHAYNAIQVLQLLLVFTLKKEKDDAKHKALVTQNTLVARILASIEFEAWNIIQESYFRTKLSAEYAPQLTATSTAHLKKLRKYFRRDNVLKETRNRFGFHFDRTATLAELQRVDPTAEYELFVSQTRGNSLFYLAEEISGMALLSAIQDVAGVDTPLEAQNRLFRDLIDFAKSFQPVAEELVARIIREVDPTPDLVEVTLKNVPAIEKARVPFFIRPPVTGAKRRALK
jgi:hypothetical protein